MRSAPRVSHWLDSTKVISAFPIRAKTSIALEVFILVLLIVRATVNVDRIIINLPDFHQGIGDRLATEDTHTACEVSDLAYSRSDRIIEQNEVIISV